MNLISVLITSCDRYEFCWHGFNTCFQKFWDFSLGWPIYFATEEKKVKFDGINNIQTGVHMWSNNLMLALAEIDSEYIFLILEDFWIKKKVEEGLFAKVFDAVQRYNFDTIRICEGKSVWHKVTKLTEISGNPFYDINLSQSKKYHVSYQAGIWKKEFLLRHLIPGESANRSELHGTSRLMASKKDNPYRLGTYVYDWYLNAVLRKGGKIEQPTKDLLVSIGG